MWFILGNFRESRALPLVVKKTNGSLLHMGASWEEVSAGDGREISNVCWEDLPGMRAVCLQTKKRQRKGREGD